MCNLMLLPLLVLCSMLAVAQLTIPPTMPADRIEPAAKPFLGTFDGVACEPDNTVTGLRFKIGQAKPTEQPTATLLATFADYATPKLSELSADWNTLTFTTAPDSKGDNHDFLWITNGSIVVAFTPYRGKLVAMGMRQEGAEPLAFARTSGTLEDFVKVNGDVCSDGAAKRKFFGLPVPK